MALYNKYRPKNLDEACGQELVRQALKNQVKKNQMVHSYLFLGPAGTGKTTVARIFAAMVNCKSGMTENPPADDPFVSKILSGKLSGDVVELDAASNNGVDDIREIRENAAYGPMEMRKKIYIIDECHQLTPQAWQALLKIIEEPPEYLMFIFCTTDNSKIPATVMTRVQELSFSSLPTPMIINTLKRVAALEGIKLDEESIRLIAIASSGSMRQALTYLEKMSVLDDLDAEKVAELVGLPNRARAKDFIKAVIKEKFAESMVASSAVIGRGIKPQKFITELANYCHDVLVCKVYDMEALGYTKQEVDDVKEMRKLLDDNIENFRYFVPKWLHLFQKYNEMTIFNIQPQFQINMLFVDMYNLYKTSQKKVEKGDSARPQTS